MMTPADMIKPRTIDARNLFSRKAREAFVAECVDKIERLEPYARDTEYLDHMIASYRKSYRVRMGALNVQPGEIFALDLRIAVAVDLRNRATI